MKRTNGMKVIVLNPEAITADAGYGSEENYCLLENKRIEAYVKYNYFDKDQNKKAIKPPYRLENMPYDAKTDSYKCPGGQELKNIGSKKRITDNGYQQNLQIYQATDCQGCPLKEQCFKKGDKRILEINHQLNLYKAKVNALLTSEAGLYHRSKRPVDVEPVFGNIKHNMGFRRLILEEKEK
jgi:hypothetical protein